MKTRLIALLFIIGLGMYSVAQTPDQWNSLASSMPSNSPDRPPAVAGSLDDEFNSTPLNLGRWTWVNQGPTPDRSTAAVATIKSGILNFNIPSSITDQLSFIVQPAPATPWTVACKINYTQNVQSNYSGRPVPARFRQWENHQLGHGDKCKP